MFCHHVRVVLGEAAEFLAYGRVELLRIEILGNLWFVKPLVEALFAVAGPLRAAVWATLGFPVGAALLVGVAAGATAAVGLEAALVAEFALPLGPATASAIFA